VSLAATLRRGPRVAAALWRLARGRRAVASVNVLNRCNQACPMCAVHAAPDHALSLADLARAFAALEAGGVRIVEISGGEPFLRRDLPDVLALLDRARLLFTFNTNGTAVTGDGARALAGARGLLQVALSLDSLDAERYRRLRGRDLLPKALDGLARLQAARLPAPLKLNVAVSRHNHGEVPRLLAFARERDLFLSAFPVNQGPGAHRSASPELAADDVEREAMARLFDELARLRRRGAPLWEPSAFYRAAARFLRREPLAPCGAGRLYLDVRADGSVAPCVELPAVASLDDLADGSAWRKLEAARGAVEACRAATPCCYTCTVSLAETARRPLAFAAESGRVLVAARLAGLRRRAGAAS
jgi:MoaA/NifB/PqqE/SkfB family radical SAM enzyme